MLPKFSSILELVSRFPDEKYCHQYLAHIRWEGHMVCPYSCGCEKAYVFADGIRYKCSSCRKIYTAKTGSFLEGSKLSLRTWFVAMYLITHKRGISSIQLSKDMGVTQKTAWFVLQRIRKVLGNEPIKKLQGIVEVDEAFVGGKNKNRHYDKKYKYGKGRRYEDKTTVFGMLERDGRVVAVVMPSPKKTYIYPAVYSMIHRGSTIMSDEFRGYKKLKSNYVMHTCNHKKGVYVDGYIYTNGIENFWSGLKRMIIGVYVQVSKKHLNKYVNECVFRFNNRKLSVQEQINVMIKHMNVRLKYKDLIAS